MAFEEKTQPYELLFRFDEATGELKGAHYRTIGVVLRDGVPIAATPSDAMEVSLAKGASGLDLTPILGTLAVAQQAKIDEHERTIATHAAELAAKDANAQELFGKLDEQRLALEAMTADRDRLRIVVDTFAVEAPPVDAAPPGETAPANPAA